MQIYDTQFDDKYQDELPLWILVKKMVKYVPLVLQLNTLRARLNGRRFVDNIFKLILLYKNICILINI